MVLIVASNVWQGQTTVCDMGLGRRASDTVARGVPCYLLLAGCLLAACQRGADGQPTETTPSPGDVESESVGPLPSVDALRMPARMSLSAGAHIEAPVVPIHIEINGVDFAQGLVALTAGWQDGLGASTSLVELSKPSGGSDTVTFDLLWVELFSTRAYKTSFSLPLNIFEVHQLSERYLNVIVLFGRHGELQVRTQPQEGMAGASRAIHSTCAEREPDRDIDFADPTNDALVFPHVLDRRGAPEAESSCPPPQIQPDNSRLR